MHAVPALPADWKPGTAEAMAYMELVRDIRDFDRAQSRMQGAVEEVLEVLKGTGCLEVLETFTKAREAQNRIFSQRVERERLRLFGPR